MRRDPSRLDELKRLALLDTAPEAEYDALTAALAASFGVPIVMINLLDAERDWFKSTVGLPLTELPAATSFCEVFFRTEAELMIVDDTLLDPVFSTHPLVVGPPNIRFYASARLMSGGHTVGTLCAYDLQPRQVTPEQVDDLCALAEAAMKLMEQRPG